MIVNLNSMEQCCFYHVFVAMVNVFCLIKKNIINGNDNNRNSSKSNKDNNNYQLDMLSVIFHNVDYFIDSNLAQIIVKI